MGLLDLLKRFSTFPDAGGTTYRCTNCNVVLDDAELACRECGGEVEAADRSPIELYWPHH